MANINLQNILKNKTLTSNIKTISPVDSNIKLSHNLNNPEIYSDIKLDLGLSKQTGSELNSTVINYDIDNLVNEESVLNSLKNVLNTKFNSRLLNPEMNFDLRSYLFENVSQAKAYFIGYDIMNIIPQYEPRIKIQNISVVAYYGDDAYGIYMTIYIPSLNKSLKLSSILSNDGFSL